MARPVETAALYCRLSKMANSVDGLSAAIPRQEKEGRRVIRRRWGKDVIVRLYVDDDVSAWSGKRRPDYERMLEDVTNGTVQAVASYDLDRLHRQPRELENFFDVCERAGLAEMATAQGELDLGTSQGKMFARMLGAHAAMSSDDTSRRLKDMWEHRASEGKPGGGKRAFGWADKMTPDPVEAPIVTELVGRFLAGESQKNLARDLNARGIPTMRGAGGWASSTIRGILINPRHAGIRELRRPTKRGGRPEVLLSVQAQWPAIISRADHERVLAILTDPSRRSVNPPRRGPLTGLVKCSLCGCGMGSAARSKKPGNYGNDRTACQTHSNTDNCGRVTISRPMLEAEVIDQVFYRLDSIPGLPSAVLGKSKSTVVDDAAAAELAQVTERLAELTDMFTAGEIDRVALLRGRKTLEVRRTALTRALSRQRRTAALDGFIGKPGALRASWEGLSIDRQRAILASLIDRVVVSPALSLGPFDKGRVTIEWRS